MSYLRYWCLFAYSGVQHIYIYFSSRVSYAASGISELSIFLLPPRYSLLFIQRTSTSNH